MMEDLYVTKKIGIIERLKSGALYKIADIFNSGGAGEGDKSADVADLIILLYILAEKMGRPFAEIDADIKGRLRAEIKGGKSEWREELSLLLRHFED